MINEKIKKKPVTNTASVNASICLVHPPLRALKKSIEEEDSFRGIIFSSVYIETYGKERIIEYLKFHNSESKEISKAKSLNLKGIINKMYSLGIIDKVASSQLHELREKRNKIVHKKHDGQLIEKEDALRMIQNAIRILETLGAN